MYMNIYRCCCCVSLCHVYICYTYRICPLASRPTPTPPLCPLFVTFARTVSLFPGRPFLAAPLFLSAFPLVSLAPRSFVFTLRFLAVLYIFFFSHDYVSCICIRIYADRVCIYISMYICIRIFSLSLFSTRIVFARLARAPLSFFPLIPLDISLRE